MPYRTDELRFRVKSPQTNRKSVKIGVIDLITKKPANSLYTRIKNPNFASIMPQVVAVCGIAKSDTKVNNVKLR